MKTISCFSYKGGAGRSTLALNVIPFLAERLNATPEEPLIVVDMDIDSCGLTYLYELQDINDAKDFNVQSLFGAGGHIPKDKGSATEHKLFLHLCPVGEHYHMPNRSILCLPAMPGGKLGLTNYDAPEGLLEEFRDECDNVGCCGILFDSAVGNQLTAGWSNRFSKYILCVMRPTKQFRDGTNRFFDNFDKRVGKNKNIIIVPNVVPTDELTIIENGEERHYPEYARTAILNDFSDNVSRGNNNYILDLAQGDIFGVPKIDRFMWLEGILYNVAENKLSPTEKDALKQYKKIADLICK